MRGSRLEVAGLEDWQGGRHQRVRSPWSHASPMHLFHCSNTDCCGAHRPPETRCGLVLKDSSCRGSHCGPQKGRDRLEDPRERPGSRGPAGRTAAPPASRPCELRRPQALPGMCSLGQLMTQSNCLQTMRSLKGCHMFWTNSNYGDTFTALTTICTSPAHTL